MMNNCSECNGYIIKNDDSENVCISCGLVQGCNYVYEYFDYYKNNSNRKKTHKYQYKQYFDFYMRCFSFNQKVEIPKYVILLLQNKNIENIKDLKKWLNFYKFNNLKRHSYLIWFMLKNESLYIPKQLIEDLKILFLRFTDIYESYKINIKKILPLNLIIRLFLYKLEINDFTYEGKKPTYFIPIFKYSYITINRDQNIEVFKKIINQEEFLLHNKILK